MTNGDKIRAMTDEELADAIMKDHNIAYAIDFCHSDEKCSDYMDDGNSIPEEWCKRCLIRWLKEEVAE